MFELDDLTAAWKTAWLAENALRTKLEDQYGKWWKSPSKKQDAYAKLRNAAESAAERVFSWLDVHSPRDRRRTASYYWILQNITLADALTSGPLSIVPPPSYGSTPQDAARFAAAV